MKKITKVQSARLPYLIVLIGLKHAGKSTAAEALRTALQYHVYSLDQGVAALGDHATAADAYRVAGRRLFRRMEYGLLRDQLCAVMKRSGGKDGKQQQCPNNDEKRHCRPTPDEAAAAARHRGCVIDCGGGVVSYAPTRRLLRAFVAVAVQSTADDDGGLALVYLQAAPQSLIGRFGDRPAFLSANAMRARAQWKRIAARRARQYAALRPITIAADALTPFVTDPRALATTLLARIDEARRRQQPRRESPLSGGAASDAAASDAATSGGTTPAESRAPTTSSAPTGSRTPTTNSRTSAIGSHITPVENASSADATASGGVEPQAVQREVNDARE